LVADAKRAEQYSNATPGFYRATAVLTNAAAANAPWPVRRRGTTTGTEFAKPNLCEYGKIDL
jgi:hypothetical protein